MATEQWDWTGVYDTSGGSTGEPTGPPSADDPRYAGDPAAAGEPGFIGLPSGTTTGVSRRGVPGEEDLAPTPTPGGRPTVRDRGPSALLTAVEARYREGDEYTTFAGLAPEAVADIQAALIAAGLLDPDGFRPGIWDPETAGAMADVLGHANRTGRDWVGALDQLVATPPTDLTGGGGGRGQGAQRRPFVAPVYQAPDYATLAQAVKTTIRRQLGREPRDWEVAQLADVLSDLDRQQFGAQLKAEQAGHAAVETAVTTGADQPSATVQAVDAESRFAQLFEERYGPEMRTEQREEDTAANVATVLGGLTRMDSLIRSRRT